MKMLRLEKFLVNRLQSKKRALGLARKLLTFAELKGKQDFLEVGCGSGVVSKYFARSYHFSVTGIDIDPEQIKLAAKDTHGIPNTRFLEADATDLPFEDSSFDIVLSFGVMHHIYNWLGAIKEIKRVLRIGGYLIYADLIYPKLITKWDRSSKLSFGLATVGLDELNAFIHQNGFTTIHASLTSSFVCRNYEAVYRRD